MNQEKAAQLGEPSYVWRAGQERRLQMILDAVDARIQGEVLVNGCGLGMYAERLAPHAGRITALDIDFERAQHAHQRSPHALCAASEHLPFPAQSFDVILSHEVLEHVQDDQRAVAEMARTLRPAGRMVIFVPNRGYPFETHGVYWRGRYRFGNIPLVNYLPKGVRARLAPHVRAYTRAALASLFVGLPLQVIHRETIFGAYDNLITRWPRFGASLRAFLHALEGTPVQLFGLSHFWVLEKI